MSLVELLAPLVVVGTGVYIHRRPMEVRSFVSPETWKESPQVAERNQREKARHWGLVFVAVGLFWLFVTLVS